MMNTRRRISADEAQSDEKHSSKPHNILHQHCSGQHSVVKHSVCHPILRLLENEGVEESWSHCQARTKIPKNRYESSGVWGINVDWIRAPNSAPRLYCTLRYFYFTDVVLTAKIVTRMIPGRS